MKKFKQHVQSKAGAGDIGTDELVKTLKGDTPMEEACWDSHKQVGMKKKGNKMVPNCVPKNEDAEYDNEGGMSKNQLKTMIDAAQELHGMLKDDDNMPEWVQSKITKATDYIDTVRDYMKSNDVNEGSETWEAGYKRRVVKTTSPEHKEAGHKWRIKGKDKANLSIKLYKEKPSQAEFNKQMKRVAGHEFGG